MASGFTINIYNYDKNPPEMEEMDVVDLIAPEGRHPATSRSYAGFPALNGTYAGIDSDMPYHRHPFPADVLVHQGVDIRTELCLRSHRPGEEYKVLRHKRGGVGGATGETFYIWKPSRNSIQVTNTEGTALWTDNNCPFEIVFFRICGPGGGGGSGTINFPFGNTSRGAGGGGGGVGVGWIRIPRCSAFSGGVKVVLGTAGNRNNGGVGTDSSIVSIDGGGTFTAKHAMDGRLNVGGAGGSHSGNISTDFFAVRGTNGGTGNKSNQSAGGCSISFLVDKFIGLFDALYGVYMDVDSPGAKSGFNERGAGGSSIASGTDHTHGTDGAGGSGGEANSSNWLNGSSGAFFLYY